MSLDIIFLELILGTPLLIALVLILLRGRGTRFAGWLAVGSAVITLGSTFGLLPALYGGGEPAVAFSWIPTANIQLRLHVDWLTLPFLMTEAAVTLSALVYSLDYHHNDERSGYFYALLLLFGVGMSGTTLADDLFLFYVFWELMLIASCLLILVWGEGEQRGAVALKYFIFTHVGSLMVLVGLLVLYDATGTDSLVALRAGGWSLEPAMLTTVLILFFVGFSVKMAIFPLHLWLPDAHTVAPMPVTIMLAAAMLSMGTYGILRFPFSLFSIEQLTPFARPLMIAGLISELYGALMSLAEKDIKRIIAYSSVSQMGYILFGLGTMTRAGIEGATLHVIYHGIVKALLFMIAGAVIYVTGKRQIDALGGLSKAMPALTVCTAIGALGIAGMPPLGIFNSEWMIFAGGFETTHIVLSILTLFGSLLTVVYALRFAGGIFLGERPEGLELRTLPHSMFYATVALTALLVIEGLFPGPLFDWAAHELPLLLGGGL
ncbi:MAG: NADH-quinone oxidoreductase subunit M [Chloroflexi bacterium]|jgi:proton-translocating NADH-quinone oxidoreductase chain M|nr:NADH-quinone oxidoreductase subunit M [Chloroflexota bacterium]